MKSAPGVFCTQCGGQRRCLTPLNSMRSPTLRPTWLQAKLSWLEGCQSRTATTISKSRDMRLTIGTIFSLSGTFSEPLPEKSFCRHNTISAFMMRFSICSIIYINHARVKSHHVMEEITVKRLCIGTLTPVYSVGVNITWTAGYGKKFDGGRTWRRSGIAGVAGGL